MIEKKTVLVLGAGASKPYNFPLGQKLIDMITNEVSFPNGRLRQKLIECSFESDLINKFSTDLRDSPLGSIDIFLETRPEYLKIGRTSIAISLLPLESVTNFVHLPRGIRLGTHKGATDTWYDYLFGKLHDPGTPFGKNQLKVITFNYDRSFEQFLFLAVKSCNPDKNESEIASMVQTIPIIHLYGSLGRLPWQKEEVGLSSNVIPFGIGAESLTSDILIKSADSIKIMSDSNGVTPAFERAKEILKNAERIYFLGFGFYKKNVERLGSEWSMDRNPRVPDKKKVMGTAYHLDATGKANAYHFSNYRLSTETLINRMITPTPTLFDKDVYTFLYNHVNFST